MIKQKRWEIKRTAGISDAQHKRVGMYYWITDVYENGVARILHLTLKWEGGKMRYLKFFCRITPVEESVHLWRNPRTFFSLKNRQRQLYSFASCFAYRIRLYHCTIIRRYRLTRSSPFFRKRLRKENKNFSSLTNYIDIYSLSRNFHSLFQRTPFSLRGSTK